jgi:hypothetical protein
MSCGRVSLLTKVTRPPAETVTERGDTPQAVIVIVAVDPPGAGVGAGVGAGAGAGAGVGVGELGESLLPPHDGATREISAAKDSERRVFFIRKTSSRY